MKAAILFIPRQTLIDACEAGIETSDFDDLTVTQIRSFARSAEEVGLNFSNGCPMKCLGLTDGSTEGKALDFTRGFDPVFAEGFQWPNEDGEMQLRSNTIAYIVDA